MFGTMKYYSDQALLFLGSFCRYHVDCCAMEVAWKQLARKIPASAKHAAETKDTTQVESDDGLIGSDDDVASSFDVKSQIVSPIGPGVLRASLGHPAHGVSWCTRTILTPGSSNPQPTLNFCGAQHGARLAFKQVLVFCFETELLPLVPLASCDKMVGVVAPVTGAYV